MYLPSRKKARYTLLFFVFVILALAPFKGLVRNLFVILTSKLLPIYDTRYGKKMEDLKKENLALKLRLKKYQDLETENKKLKEALDFQREKKIDIEGVNVISFSPSAWRRTVIVNAGKNRDIERGSIVIDERGYMVGKIRDVNEDYSEVVLADDPSFNIPVFVGEAHMGMLKGNLIGARIMYIENEKEVKKGDKIWIKAPSSSATIELGKVRRVVNDENTLFLDIEASLSLNEAFNDKLFIIR